MLSSLGDKHRLVFYIDGGAALEEKDAHQQRRQKRGKAGKEAGTALDTLQSRIHNNKRLTRQHFLRANKSINAAFYWATEDRVSFAEYLTERTYHVVMCDTEADTRIAADCRDVDVILSRDSDYMGYRSVRTIWRPVGGWNINKCLVYSKDDILASLEFTDVQLIALACVTKNDYEPNIRGLALVSNFGIMKDLGSRDGKTGFFGLDQMCLLSINNGFVLIRQMLFFPFNRCSDSYTRLLAAPQGPQAKHRQPDIFQFHQGFCPMSSRSRARHRAILGALIQRSSPTVPTGDISVSGTKKQGRKRVRPA